MGINLDTTLVWVGFHKTRAYRKPPI